MNNEIKQQCEMLSYATQILCDDEIQITADKIKAVLNAAGANVNDVLIRMFENAVGNVNLKEELWNFTKGAGSGPASSGVTIAAPGADGEEPEEEKEAEESEEESLGFDLFG